MCKNCKNKGCDGCGNNSSNSMASLESQVADLQETVQALSDAASFLLCGHPIIEIDDPDDIESFDLTTGLGFNCWEGWAICDGQSHLTADKKKTIATPNLIDRFIVGAGGTYQVGDTGGLDTVVLSIPELPAHGHVVTDPGHQHVITDPGHTHEIIDPGHNHPTSGGNHFHTIPDHKHDLNPAVFGTNYNGGTGPFAPAVGYTGSDTNYGGLETNTKSLQTDMANAGITVNATFTGIQDDPAFTGVIDEPAATGITLQNTGSNTPHENRPPYFALIFVKRIG